MTVRSVTRTPAAPGLAVADVEALSEHNNEPQWLRERRLAAWELYESLPMPSTSDEAWRRTDYRRIKWREAGRLIMPFALAVPSPFAYFLVMRKAVADRASVAAFRDWLLRQSGVGRPDNTRVADGV